MKLNDQQQSFVDWLNRLLAEVRRLHVVLEREQKVLHEHQLESLQLLAKDKNALVERIDTLLAQLPGQAETKEEVIAKLMNALNLVEHGVSGLWHEVQRLISACRALNETNGATIALLQEHNSHALALLFGPRRHRICYGADGQGRTEADDRLLAAT